MLHWHSKLSGLAVDHRLTHQHCVVTGDSAEAQPTMREMATQTSDVSDDGACGSRQSRRTRASPPQRLDGATSISPRQTSPAGRGALPALAPDLALPGQLPDQAQHAGQSLPTTGRTVLPGRVGPISGEAGATGLQIEPPEPARVYPVAQEAAAVRSGSTLPEHPADQPSSQDGLQAAHAEQALQVHIDEPIVSVVRKASGYVYQEGSCVSAANPKAAGTTIEPESNGEDAPPSAATGETGRGSHVLADRFEASPQTVPEALPAAPRRSSSGGVRALAAMFEQRRSLDGPAPAPPARPRGLGVVPGTSQQLRDARARLRPADALLHDASARHTQECPRESWLPSQGGAEGPKPVQQSQAPAATAVANYTPGPAAAVEQGSALVSAKPAVPLPASVFGGGHSGRGEPPGDPFAELLAGFGEAFAPRQTQPPADNHSISSTDSAARASMEASAEPGEALPAAEPTESLPGAADAAAASPGSDGSLASASPSSGSAGAAAAAKSSHQPRVRVQDIQTDDSEAGVPSLPNSAGLSAIPDAAAAAEAAALTPNNDGLYGCEDLSANSSCFTSPALSPRMVRSSRQCELSCAGFIWWCQRGAAGALHAAGWIALIAEPTAGYSFPWFRVCNVAC